MLQQGPTASICSAWIVAFDRNLPATACRERVGPASWGIGGETCQGFAHLGRQLGMGYSSRQQQAKPGYQGWDVLTVHGVVILAISHSKRPVKMVCPVRSFNSTNTVAALRHRLWRSLARC